MGAGKECATTNTIPFELMSGLIVVDTRVNGTPQRFIVDTGASHTVLTTKAARSLGLEAAASEKTATGAAGGAAAEPIKVRSFKWGDMQLSDSGFLDWKTTNHAMDLR